MKTRWAIRVSKAPRVPVITNVAARPVEDPEELRQNLIAQITQPVRWADVTLDETAEAVRLRREMEEAFGS